MRIRWCAARGTRIGARGGLGHSRFAALVLLRQKRGPSLEWPLSPRPSIVIGWGVGQYPDVLVDQATINDVAGAHSTMVGLVVVFAIAAVTVVHRCCGCLPGATRASRAHRPTRVPRPVRNIRTSRRTFRALA